MLKRILVVGLMFPDSRILTYLKFFGCGVLFKACVLEKNISAVYVDWYSFPVE